MRIMVFFDLPSISDSEKRSYRYFVKYLKKSGFVMMQESVYVKLALNNSIADSVINTVKKNLPNKGLVQLLKITEKQFGSIEYLIGDSQTTVIDNDKRLVEL